MRLAKLSPALVAGGMSRDDGEGEEACGVQGWVGEGGVF